MVTYPFFLIHGHLVLSWSLLTYSESLLGTRRWYVIELVSLLSPSICAGKKAEETQRQRLQLNFVTPKVKYSCNFQRSNGEWSRGWMRWIASGVYTNQSDELWLNGIFRSYECNSFLKVNSFSKVCKSMSTVLVERSGGILVLIFHYR